MTRRYATARRGAQCRPMRYGTGAGETTDPASVVRGAYRVLTPQTDRVIERKGAAVQPIMPDSTTGHRTPRQAGGQSWL